MWLLGRILFFLLINFFNVGIFWIAFSYIRLDGNEAYVLSKFHYLNNPWFVHSLYIHGISACIALLFISSLVLFRIEHYVPLHKALGKLALITTIFVAVPSGIVLSKFATGGFWGTLLFFSLAIYTGYTAIQGYLAVKQTQINRHKWWMRELLCLLCSAILLRLLMTIFAKGFHWMGDSMYLTSAILSWIPSVIIINLIRLKANR